MVYMLAGFIPERSGKIYPQTTPTYQYYNVNKLLGQVATSIDAQTYHR